MRPLSSFKATTLIAAALVLGVLGGAAFIYFGVYNIAATEQHTRVTYHLMHTAMKRSVAMRAKDVNPPDLRDPQRQQRGLVLFRDHCVQCHGGPGVAPEPFALGLRPAPVNLVQTARDWPAREIYWVVKHGIKMTGMPGWQFRMTENDLWDVVAFVDAMTTMSPREYREKAQSAGASMQDAALRPLALPQGPNAHTDLPRANAAPAIGPPTAKAGLHAIYQYACVTCHVIPGAVGADNNVGPTLKGIAGRSYIAGVLSNNRENMVRWLMDPQAVDPRTAMPDLRVTRRDAEDIAAYLATLD